MRTTPRTTSRRGLGLLEVLVAATLLALGLFKLTDLLRQSAHVSERGTRVASASVFARSVLDRLLSEGYHAWASAAGKQVVLDLSEYASMGVHHPEDGSLEVDGMVYLARAGFTQLEPGLVRVDLDVTWVDRSRPDESRVIPLVRYLANPHEMGEGVR